MAWYYVDQTEQKGPVDETAFQELLQSGQITPETLVWRDGLAEWMPYGQVNSLAEETGALAPNIQTGTPVIADSAPTDLVYGGFWIRLLAEFLDYLLLTAIYGGILTVLLLTVFKGLPDAIIKTLAANPDALTLIALVMPLYRVLIVVSIVLNLSYQTFFIGKWGATLGKRACGLKVVRPDGSPVSYLQALGRFLGRILSSLIFCIGYIMIGFDAQKRALHDRICGTRVIKK